jgi:hypothetical protein
MDKEFYAELLREALDGILNRQYLTPSQQRQFQYFQSRHRPFSLTDESLRDMLTSQSLTPQQMDDLLWLLQMMKTAPLKHDRGALLEPVLSEFERYHEVGVLNANTSAVRDANEVTSHRGEIFLRQFGYSPNNILDFVHLNLYVYEAHGAVNRHALALYRARMARTAIERFVDNDFISHPNAFPYLRELYVHSRLAETVAMRNLANSQKSTSQWRVVEAIREVVWLLDKNLLGELEHPDKWRLNLLRDEIRSLSRISRATVADIDGVYGKIQTVFSRSPQYGDDDVIRYMQIETEMKGFLRVRSSRDGVKLALQRAQMIPLERIDSLNVGILHKVSILRGLAMLRHRTKEMDAVTHILEKAYHMASEAGLSHQLMLVNQDADRFKLK